MKTIKPLSQIVQCLESYPEKVIEIQRKLVAIPALAPENGGQGERDKAEYVKGLLQQIGVDEIKELNAPDPRVSCGYRPNLLAKYFGEHTDRTVWVMAHLDVVPPGDLKLWSGDPFTLRVEGDRLIGRGVEDNHQGLISAMLALKAIKGLNIKPLYNIGLAIVADEETGSKYGLQYLMDKHGDEFRPKDLFIVPDAGDALGQQIEIAEKSILWLKIKVLGKQCHASTPGLGINAHRAAAHLTVKLDRLKEIFAAKNDLFDPPESTFEPTKKEANVPNINTIPPEDIFYLDARVLPQYPLQMVEKKIREMADEIENTFGVKIVLEPCQYAEAAPPTKEDSAGVIALKKAIEAIRGLEAKCVGIGGGTVAAIFRRAGYDAAVWSTLDDTAHQPDEFASIKNTIDDAKVLAHVFMCGDQNTAIV